MSRINKKHYSGTEIKDLKSIITSTEPFSSQRKTLLQVFCLKNSRNVSSVKNKVWRMDINKSSSTKAVSHVGAYRVVSDNPIKREIVFPIKSMQIVNNSIVIKY